MASQAAAVLAPPVTCDRQEKEQTTEEKTRFPFSHLKCHTDMQRWVVAILYVKKKPIRGLQGRIKAILGTPMLIPCTQNLTTAKTYFSKSIFFSL